MMHLCGARAVALAATSSRDEVSLQVTRMTQKACGSNSLSGFWSACSGAHSRPTRAGWKII
jgi:hypothetical protein